jgi:hypothetical protein
LEDDDDEDDEGRLMRPLYVPTPLPELDGKVEIDL